MGGRAGSIVLASIVLAAAAAVPAAAQEVVVPVQVDGVNPPDEICVEPPEVRPDYCRTSSPPSCSPSCVVLKEACHDVPVDDRENDPAPPEPGKPPRHNGTLVCVKVWGPASTVPPSPPPCDRGEVPEFVPPECLPSDPGVTVPVVGPCAPGALPAVPDDPCIPGVPAVPPTPPVPPPSCDPDWSPGLPPEWCVPRAPPVPPPLCPVDWSPGSSTDVCIPRVPGVPPQCPVDWTPLSSTEPCVPRAPTLPPVPPPLCPVDWSPGSSTDVCIPRVPAVPSIPPPSCAPEWTPGASTDVCVPRVPPSCGASTLPTSVPPECLPQPGTFLPSIPPGACRPEWPFPLDAPQLVCIPQAPPPCEQGQLPGIGVFFPPDCIPLDPVPPIDLFEIVRQVCVAEPCPDDLPFVP